MSAPRVVALGGGHGLSVSLSALCRLTPHVTAVVSVADDGGSSGRLRRELGVLPPGDLRMALVSMSGDDDDQRALALTLQHRFGGSGALAGHAVGNLLLAGLVERTGDPVAALGLLGRLLGLPEGARVLPMSCEPVELVAVVRDGNDAPERRVQGQLAVATVRGQVCSVRLEPETVAATPAAVAAVEAADVLTFGPGSLFTSVLPHLLVTDLRKALVASRARRVLVQNLAPQDGETSGFSPQRHLLALRGQVADLDLDLVVADRASVTDVDALTEAAGAFGAQLVLADVADPDHPGVHHPDRLSAVLAECLR